MRCKRQTFCKENEVTVASRLDLDHSEYFSYQVRAITYDRQYLLYSGQFVYYFTTTRIYVSDRYTWWGSGNQREGELGTMTPNDSLNISFKSRPSD